MALLVGFSVLGREELTPVARSEQSPLFPAGSTIRLDREKYTLLLFVHPLCPCTHASLRELESIMDRVQGRVSVNIIFTIPDGLPAGWDKEESWKVANDMPGAHLYRDPNGHEAQLFNVQGSGHVLLYDLSGRLIFSGGITAARGHEGDNAGVDAIEGLVLDGHAQVNHTPVFGCSLL